MNKAILNNAFIPGERERNDAAPAAPNSCISGTYAQQNEDLIVESLLKPVLRRLGREPGSIFYIEIGANRPFQTSNTYLFYRKHGARGVLVGANHQHVQQLKAARPEDEVVVAAVGARHDAAVTFQQSAIPEPAGPNKTDVLSVGKNAAIGPGTVTNLHINALLERYADRQIDYLSIDIEGADIEVLEAMNFDKYRPYFVQCRPSEHFLPSAADKIAGILETRGYMLVARTEISLIFVDRAILSSAAVRRAVRSFDVFDTLIARNCIDPHIIFSRVEALTQNAGFAADRRAAEQRVSNRAYTLDDIYDDLMRTRGWSQDERDHAQAAEIFLELEAVIPIAENLAHVRDGDVAVSDMYLPESVIRMLLKKAGLAKEIGVVVSAHGKRSGEIWPHLLANYHIEQHLGDNKIADIESPERFGISSRHTPVASPDIVELWLINNGMRDLAQVVRQARLASWSDDPTLRQLQLIQTRYNFPILLLSSIVLARFVAANKIENVLFCSRDCNLWQDLFSLVRKQMGVETNELYFYTSRQARLRSSPSYRRYATEMLQGSSVLVDICGTGWSLSHLQQGLGTYAPLFFIHHIPKMDVYEKMRPTPAGVAVHSIVGVTAPECANNYLEMANYADHPQVVDVSYIHNTSHPVFAQERRSLPMLQMVRGQRDSFRQIIALCEAQGLGGVLNVPDDKLRAMVLELYKSLCAQKILPTIYESMHVEEEAEQLKILKKLA